MKKSVNVIRDLTLTRGLSIICMHYEKGEDIYRKCND